MQRVDYRTRWQQKRRERVTRQRLIIIVGCMLAAVTVVVGWRSIVRPAPAGFRVPGADICWLTAGEDYLLVCARSGRLVRTTPELSGRAVGWARDFTHPSGFLAPAVLVPGLALIGCADVRLRAVDVTTGLQAWELEAGGAVPSVAAGDGHVYFGSEDGFVHAATVQGRYVWHTGLGAPVVAPPLVTEDHVIVATLAGEVYCLARENGARVWMVDTGAPIYAAPRMGPSTIIVGDDAGKLHNITPEGELVAEYAFEGLVRAPVGTADTVVVAGDSAGNVARINPSDMTEMWRTTVPGPVTTEPVIHAGAVWCGAGSNLVVLDAETGRTRRRLAAGAETTDVLAAFGRIYWATADGRVRMINP